MNKKYLKSKEGYQNYYLVLSSITHRTCAIALNGLCLEISKDQHQYRTTGVDNWNKLDIILTKIPFLVSVLLNFFHNASILISFGTVFKDTL